MNNLIYVSVLILFSAFSVFSQSSNSIQQNCGTKGVNPIHQQLLESLQENPELFERYNKRATEFIPVTIHIVGDINGNGFFPKSDAFRNICEVNAKFEAAGMYFYITGDIRYIKNNRYYIHTFDDGFNMMGTFNVPNTVNIYFVEDPAGNCGYFSPGADGVAIAKSCAGASSTTLAHELGHFFSLPHTFSGWEGMEYNGTKYPSGVEFLKQTPGSRDKYDCTRTGDKFCDTKADYFSDRWNCDNADAVNDPDKDTFDIDPKNIMCYALDRCVDGFSNNQVNAMLANLANPRKNLRGNKPATFVNLNAAKTISPLTASSIPVNNVTLNWEVVPGATSYHVLVTEFPTQGVIVQDFIVNSTSINVAGLVLNKNYGWKVKPLMQTNTCADYSKNSWFKVVDFNSIPEVLNSVQILPNPVSDILEIRGLMESTSVQILNLQGQLIQQFIATKNQEVLNVSELVKGMYIVEFKYKGEIKTQKIVKL